MAKWFKSQSKILRAILLIIPFVNWIVELLIRWPNYLKTKKTEHLIMAILVTIPTGIAFGIIDAILTLITDDILLG